MAGFFGFFDYTKPGKGVDENAPPKRQIFVFFEVMFRKFWKIIQVNLLYFVAIIPSAVVLLLLGNIVLAPILNILMAQNYDGSSLAITVIILNILFVAVFVCLLGAGPVTAGFVYVIRNFTREEHTWVWSDFWEHTKKNFKQAIIVFLVDVLAVYIFYIALNFYSNAQGMISNLKYVMIVFFVIYIFMHLYIYPMMVTFKLSLKALYKNAFLFAFAKLPQNILITLFVVAVLAVSAYYAPSLFVTVPLLLFSLCGYISVFWAYPTLRKYMIIQNDEVKSDD